MIVKFLYKALNFFVFFILFFLQLFLIFKKKRKLPKLIMLSLTKSQFNYKHKDELLNFFQENRFDFKLSNEVLLIETRHLFFRKIFSVNKNTIVTVDLFAYLILHHIKGKNFTNLYREINSKINLIYQKKFNLKFYKQNIFDLSVWDMISAQIQTKTFLVTTQTHMKNIPSIFKIQNKTIKKVMLWYSTNSVPIYKFGEVQLEQWLNKDIVKYIDEHYVWNIGQALDLKKQGIINYRVVGSILFYPKKLTKAQENFVTYFDVTPLKNANTIYSIDSCILTLMNISSCILELNEKYKASFILRVKPKRRPSKLHAASYTSTLKKMQKAGNLQIVDWNANLYSCIGSSSLILAMPYSSPIEIGNEMGIPGAYYFEGDSRWKLELDRKTSPVFTRKNQLKFWIETNLYSGHNLLN